VEAVDYTGDVATLVRERHPGGVDALIDVVNRDHDAFAAMAGLVRAGGRATSAVGGAGEAKDLGRVTVSNVGGNPAHLSALAEGVARGRLRVPVTRSYPLSDAADALHDFAAKHTVGKLVVVPT
jgi:NADPH:quinone reductase-like Zn-dependent oxidoreductase